jgi:methyl-accepting chemotaxis protein/methyl-accepting chemotaxis protein-1 (serine sensor receptor)
MSFTIGKKLFLGVGALVIFTFALGVTALMSISSIGDRLHTIVDVTAKKQSLANGMYRDSAELTSDIRGILLRGMMKDTATIRSNQAQFAASADSLQSSIQTITPLLSRPEAKQAVLEIQEDLNTMRSADQGILQAVAAGNTAAGVTILDNTVKPAEKRLDADALQVLKAQDETLASDADASTAAAEESRWLTGLLLALAAVVGVVVVFVVRQINGVLRASVSELGEASAQIASAASQVSSSSQSLAQGASEQTATIEETSSASAEINSMARRNTENSRSAAEMVTSSREGFEKANQSLTEMVGAMDGINASSQKISKIIKVIDEIAFQTNILALNAAVEAARAGEAGMGFAVVADEVRNLAQRCAQAAKDTADLIEDSIQKSDGGRVKVDQVSVAIRAITADSSKIKVLVDEISLGSVEQSSGIDQISRAITQMEQVTQSSAANAEESAAAAEELNAQAEAMKDVVETLRAMVDGGGSVVRTTPDQTRRVTPGNAQWARMEG